MKFLLLFLLALAAACSSPIVPDPPVIDAAVILDSTSISDSAVIDAQIPLDDAAVPCSEPFDLSAGTPSPDWTVTAITATTTTPSAMLSIPVGIRDDVTWLAADFSGVTGADQVSVTLMYGIDNIVEIVADGNHVHSVPVNPPHTARGPHTLIITTSTSLVEVTVRDVVVGYKCVLSP